MKNLLNLYTDELRERPVPYGFPWLLAALLATSALMLGYGLWTQQRLAGMEEEQQQLNERQQALNSSIVALEGQLVKDDQLQVLERDIARLQQANTQRETLLMKLQQQIQQPVKGFSPQLRGLSAAHGQGVWLTHIQLTFLPEKQGDPSSLPMNVRLSGRMHQGQQLPRYMDALAEVEAFRGLRFNSMQVLRRTSEDKTIAFLISTRMDDQLDSEESP
ncbi:MAG: hypothetical protein P3W87_004450 [Gammaproteobacteria bacterium]|nr:hypothetical protein [Gammaproteobacteria bacterium]